MKHHFCWRHTILEGDVQSLELEKLDPNRLKLLQRHILDVSELVVSIGSVRKRPHTAYGAIAFKLPWNKITVYHGVIRAGRDIDCIWGCRLQWRTWYFTDTQFRICGDSQINASRQFHGEIGVSIVLLNLSWRVAKQRYLKAVGWWRHVRYSSR